MDENYRTMDRDQILEIITEKIDLIKEEVSARDLDFLIRDLEEIENMVVEL